MSFDTAASVFKPLKVNDFAKMVHDGTIEYASIFSFALKSDGSPLIIARLQPRTAKVKGRMVTTPGDVVHYNLTDALSSTGAILANQGIPAAIANRWPVQLSDGTNTIGTATPANDVFPTSANVLPVENMNYGFNGTTWERLKSSSGSLQQTPSRANASPPTWTENSFNPLSVDLAGNLRTMAPNETILLASSPRKKRVEVSARRSPRHWRS